MLNIFTLLLATSVFALVERDVAKVKSDLVTVDNNVKNVTTQTNKFNGDIPSRIAVLEAASALNQSIIRTTGDVNDPSVPNPVSNADAAAVIGYVVSPLTPDIKTALNAIVSKKAAFRSITYVTVVSSQLVDLRGRTNQLATALINKAPSASKSSASSASSVINSAFLSAISVYSSP